MEVRDEDFECFIRVMGEATSHRQVPGSHTAKYRGYYRTRCSPIGRKKVGVGMPMVFAGRWIQTITSTCSIYGYPVLNFRR